MDFLINLACQEKGNNIGASYSYLLSVHESIDGLRLSFGNTKIAYNSKKEDKEFTEYQRTFINGLSFGTTKEKLENGDYTDLSRIIYLPKNKVYQSTHK